mgnify:CR=1 FL=1
METATISTSTLYTDLSSALLVEHAIRRKEGHLADTGALVLEELLAAARRAAALGLRDLVIITGDPPKMGDYPFATPVYDVDSIGLIRILSNLNRGCDLAGNPIGPALGIHIGCGAQPDLAAYRLLADQVWLVEADAEIHELLVHALEECAGAPQLRHDVVHDARAFVSPRRVRFSEMEYAVPRAALPQVMRELRMLADGHRLVVEGPGSLDVPSASVVLVPATAASVAEVREGLRYFLGRDRRGNILWVPLMTLSVGIVRSYTVSSKLVYAFRSAPNRMPIDSR